MRPRQKPNIHKTIEDLIKECYRLERVGKLGLAIQRGQEAAYLAQSNRENDLFASALAAQSLVHVHLGHYSRARSLAEEALTCASPSALGRAEAYIILGICASETDDLDTAETHYHAAADLSREIGHYHTLVRALHDLACGIYYPRGQFDLALITEREVLQIANQHGITDYQQNAWVAQVLIHLAAGKTLQAEEALDHLDRLVFPESQLEGYSYCLRAHLYQQTGELENVPAFYTKALAIAETAGDPGLNIETRVGLSRYHRTQSDPATAYVWANEAVKIAHRSGYHHMEGRALVERGRVTWEMGNHNSAVKDFQQATLRLAPLKAAFDLSNARLMLAVLSHQLSSAKESNQEEFLTPEELRKNWISAAQEIIAGGYGFLLQQEWRLAFPLVVAYLNDADPQAAKLASEAMSLLQHSPPPLRITTLGRFEARQGSRLIPSSDWRNRQAGELFRLLLVSPGRRLSRDQITEAMWPEKSPDAARAFFHQTSSTLRRVLEPELPDKFPSRYVFLEEGMVTLRLPPGSSVDFEIFEKYIQRGELENAHAIFAGEPFPLDTYHDWAASTREHLNLQYIGVLLKVANQKLQEGDSQEALSCCQRLLSLDPWQEQAVWIGMQACLSMKDRSGALRLYLDLERCLREELGLIPNLELRQLYQSLQ